MCLLWLRQLPHCEDLTPTSVPPPAKGRSSPTNTPVFSPSSFILLSFVWLYIFFSSGQALLSALSCCSACTSVSEGVFLMYPERDVLHVHLLLHHLFLSIVHFITIIIISAPPQIILEVEYTWPNQYLFFFFIFILFIFFFSGFCHTLTWISHQYLFC